MSQGFNEDDFAMSYKEIADTMTAQEGIVYTENQIKMITHRALAKLRDSGHLDDFKGRVRAKQHNF